MQSKEECMRPSALYDYKLWKFSKSSQPLLERCLKASAAIEIDQDNVFVKNFSHLLKKNEVKKESDDKSENIKPPSPVTVQETKEIEPVGETEEPDELIQDILENNLNSRFEFIVENCRRNNKLYTNLARALPVTLIEWFSYLVFQKENLPSDFLSNFYKVFLIEFLKREHSMSSIDVLLHGKKYHKAYFNSFLQLFIEEKNLPNLVFLQFVMILEDAGKLEIMKFILDNDLSNEAFVYHLAAIDLLYKHYEKTEKLQNYLLSKMSSVSHLCSTDKNFGRLLLNVLRNQKKYSTDLDLVENIIHQHKSSFQRVCMTEFNTLKELHKKPFKAEYNTN